MENIWIMFGNVHMVFGGMFRKSLVLILDCGAGRETCIFHIK